MRDDEHVRRERRLEHDRHVRGIEQLDGIRPPLTPEPVALHRDLEPEALQVDDHREHHHRRDQVHHIRQALPPERLPQRAAFIVPREQEVEQADDRALEFGSAAGVDRGGREGLPDDGLADVGGDEEGDAGAEAVSFLEELVEEDDDEGGGDQLDDEEETDAGADVAGLAVETGEHVDGCLAEGDNHGEDWKGTSAR